MILAQEGGAASDAERDADLSDMDEDEAEQMSDFKETRAPGGPRAETSRARKAAVERTPTTPRKKTQRERERKTMERRSGRDVEGICVTDIILFKSRTNVMMQMLKQLKLFQKTGTGAESTRERDGGEPARAKVEIVETDEMQNWTAGEHENLSEGPTLWIKENKKMARIQTSNINT